jgi:aryl-alcohol dehydrogenase-like predicted oxidoreductase
VNSTASRLILGTAQMGLRYGVANHTGMVDRAAAAEILNFARSQNIDTLDTAAAYGESERRLGELGVHQWRVVSKISAVPETADVGTWIRTAIARSLDNLGMPSLYGLLLHRPSQLTGPMGEAVYQGLRDARDRGEVEKIGISIYSPEELQALWPKFSFDLVQAPLNVIDRRLYSTGWLAKLRAADVEVHVRSIFLQGLLLMDPAARPARFNAWQPLWTQWHRWLEEQSLTALQACVGYALSLQDVDGVVIGVDSAAQLRSIVESIGTASVSPPEYLQSADIDLINPSRWSEH